MNSTDVLPVCSRFFQVSLTVSKPTLTDQTKTEEKRLANLRLNLGNLKLVDIVLIALIILGVAFRLSYPFYNNPMSHLITDPGRHYGNAMGTIDRIYRCLDPLGYQWWLGTYFKLFGNSRTNVGIYTGLLSAVTPFCWYLWLRQCLPTKRLALAGLAILALLPSWLGIYAYFMTETLLLPLLGLALWLTWRSAKRPSWQNIFFCSLAWAFATATKLTVVPEALICLTWLFWRLIKSRSKVFSFCAIFLILASLTVVYLIGVMDTYNGLGTTWLFPPRYGLVAQLYYQSGARSYTLNVESKARGLRQSGWFQSPAAFREPLLAPFSNWTSGRMGNYNVIIDCDQPPQILAPRLPMSLSNRLRFITESTVNFLFDSSWPDCDRHDIIQSTQVNMRWSWSLLLLSVVFMAIRRRNGSILVILCLGTAFITFLLEAGVMEGRYRKPWEGLVIATLLFLIVDESKSSQDQKEATEPDA